MIFSSRSIALFPKRLAPRIAAALTFVVASALPSAAQFEISNFNGVGPDFLYGNFTGTQEATTFTITGLATGGAFFGYAPTVDLTAYANESFSLTALALPGNESGIQILLSTNDVGAANDYVYYYNISAGQFNGSTFTTVVTNTLSNPDVVLDSASDFSFVGSGTGFAPNLSQVTDIQLQGFPYFTNPFAYRFDQFSIGNAAAAPEPGSIALALTAGIPMVGIVLRRRKKH